jgi:hypothetical protein
VQLDEVEGFDAQVGPGPVGPLAEVVERVVDRVQRRPPAHLGRHGQTRIRVRVQQPADQPLAPPVAVHVGRVDEGDALVDSGLEHRHGGVVVDVAPVGASCQAPRPISATCLPVRPSCRCCIR